MNIWFDTEQIEFRWKNAITILKSDCQTFALDDKFDSCFDFRLKGSNNSLCQKYADWRIRNLCIYENVHIQTLTIGNDTTWREITGILFKWISSKCYILWKTIDWCLNFMKNWIDSLIVFHVTYSAATKHSNKHLINVA